MMLQPPFYNTSRLPCSLGSYGFDSRDELLRVASLLEEYNRELGMTRQLDLEFKKLADECRRRHPFRNYARIPIERAAARWFTPRIASLPYTRLLWPSDDSWHRNSTDFDVTIGFSVLNLFYVGLALVSIAYWFENAGVGLIVIFIVLRTGFVTQLQTSEPRYVLVCLGLLPWTAGAGSAGLGWFSLAQIASVIPTSSAW